MSKTEESNAEYFKGKDGEEYVLIKQGVSYYFMEIFLQYLSGWTIMTHDKELNRLYGQMKNHVLSKLELPVKGEVVDEYHAFILKI